MQQYVKRKSKIFYQNVSNKSLLKQKVTVSNTTMLPELIISSILQQFQTIDIDKTCVTSPQVFGCPI